MFEGVHPILPHFVAIRPAGVMEREASAVRYQVCVVDSIPLLADSGDAGGATEGEIVFHGMQVGRCIRKSCGAVSITNSTCTVNCCGNVSIDDLD